MRRAGSLCISLVVLLLGAGCGGDGEVVKIGVIAPLTGPLESLGHGIRTSVELAVEQANDTGGVGGRRIEVVALDDASDRRKGAEAARAIVTDPRVVAVVGNYNSGVARAVQPILHRVRIAMISPGNTDTALTRGEDWQRVPRRPYDNYFRVVGTDRDQGRFAAGYAYGELDRTRAVVIHDGKLVQRGVSEIFASSFEDLGGTVAATIEIAPELDDYSAAVRSAAEHDPDIVWVGSEFPTAGVVAKDMYTLGLAPPDVVLMGSDGLVDPGFVLAAGTDAAQGHYATLIGAPPDLLPGADGFVSGYEERYGDTAYSSFGPPAFDATNLVVRVLRDELSEDARIDRRLREAIIAGIQRVSHRGVIGTTSFDEFGDTTNRVVTISRVEGDGWTALEAAAF